MTVLPGIISNLSKHFHSSNYIDALAMFGGLNYSADVRSCKKKQKTAVIITETYIYKSISSDIYDQNQNKTLHWSKGNVRSF